MSGIVHEFKRLENTGGIPFAGGVLFALPEDRSWPRTDLLALPSCTRTLHDTSGDAVADIALTTRVRLIDMDGNGAIEYGRDAVLLRVTGGETIQADVGLECSVAERNDAVRRVASQL